MVETTLHYKWSILFITLLALLMAAYFLYFKPSIYSSHALLEVKSDAKQGMQEGDFLKSAFSSFGNEKVDKEIEILKTFHINSHALNKVNFQIQYFVDEGYKKIEIYDDLPIEVKSVTIFDEKIVGSIVKLIPVEDGYRLQVENSFKNKMLHSLFDKELMELDDQQIYHYGDRIKTDYFELIIEKRTAVKQALYFVIKGNNRQIYEAISKNLKIIQINESAPLIEIVYEDTVSRRANEYVNAVAESFILQSVAEKSRQNDRIIDFIEKQLNDIKTKLDSSEKELERYRIEHKAIQPSLQGETYIKELSKIEVELSKNKLKEQLIQNLHQFAKKNKNLDAMAPSLMELYDQPTLDLISRLLEAQIKEEGLKAEYSGKHPGIIAVRKQISHIKKKIILNIKNLKSSMSHRNTNLEK